MIHKFKNGIKVEIPDGITDVLDKWTDTKVAMSILLSPAEPPEPPKIRKPYTFTKEGLKKRHILWHKGRKK